MPNLTSIDLLGLADPVVARNPITYAVTERRMAHDRQPPPGYLRRRGQNFFPLRVQSTEARALADANYALNIGDGVWMSFNVVDHDWANQRFASLELRVKNRFSQTDPAGNRFDVDGIGALVYVGEEFLGRFENGGMDGWQIEGKAVSNHAVNPFLDTIDPPVAGHVGPGYLTTYFLGKWERTGRATSPTFTARDDQSLAFLIAGEPHDLVGLRLLADGQEVAVWRGDNLRQFELVIHPLREVAGKELQLEIFNHEIGDRLRLMLDHVMLVRQEPAAADARLRGALNRAITESTVCCAARRRSPCCWPRRTRSLTAAGRVRRRCKVRSCTRQNWGVLKGDRTLWAIPTDIFRQGDAATKSVVGIRTAKGRDPEPGSLGCGRTIPVTFVMES